MKVFFGNDVYKGWGIKVISGINSGEIYMVIKYDGVVKIVIFDKSWMK